MKQVLFNYQDLLFQSIFTLSMEYVKVAFYVHFSFHYRSYHKKAVGVLKSNSIRQNANGPHTGTITLN